MSVTTKIIGLASTAAVFAGMAFGQALTCNVVAPTILPTTPIELRSEGATELVSDTITTCSAAPVAGMTGQVTATLSATGLQAVTSKVLSTTTGVTDATLQLTSGGVTAYYQGIVTGTTITFGGTTLATAVVFPSAAPFTLQISNVRVNVIGQYPTALQPVSEQVSLIVQGNGLATVTAIPAQIVGNMRNSLIVTGTSTGYSAPGGAAIGTAASANTYLVCSITGAQGSSAAAFSVTIGELFAGAFKTQTPVVGPPAGIPSSESGSYVPVAPLPTGVSTGTGTASFGTRFKVVFTGIPTNATLNVPITIAGNTAGFSMSLTTGGETGAYALATSTVLTATAGVATAIYEVRIADYTNVGSFTLTPFVTYAANAVVAPAGPITVAVSYAASPSANGGALTSPIPSIPYFANTSTTLNGATFAACQTTLLFPFVTNQAGFETGIVVANTGKDNLGTSAASKATGQAGACTFQFYGSTGAEGGTAPTFVAAPNFPKSTATPASIAAGATHADILTNVAGGSFQGYAIATCPFLYAKGFAYIAYGLLQNNGVAMGYTANLISNDRTAFAGSGTTVTNTAPEASGQ